jgi:choice-of-anchor A domain-containing protein
VTLINVAGTSASVGSVGITLNGGVASATLWNFYEATTLALSAINFQGSALAPNATVTFNNGQLNGTMVGYDISGNGQYNLELFGHEICF